MDDKNPKERSVIVTESDDLPEVDHADDRTLSMFRAFISGNGIAKIAQDHGVSPSTVYRARNEGNWTGKKKKVQQRRYGEAMHQEMERLEAERILKKAMDDMNIRKLEGGRYVYRVEIRVPPGGRPWGIVPADPSIQCITTPDGRYFIQRELAQVEVEELIRDRTR